MEERPERNDGKIIERDIEKRVSGKSRKKIQKYV